MIARRDLARFQETRRSKETGEAAGTWFSSGAGKETDGGLHMVWIQPLWRPTDLYQMP
jgi:hypothetical protein